MARVVFTPTGVAYGWAFLGYALPGVILYLLFMAAAYKMGLFECLEKWPKVSKVALGSGPALMVLGCYFSMMPPTYLVLIPAVIYVVLSIIGGLALVGKRW